MISYDLSQLVSFPDALTEFAEDFCHDYGIDDVRGFIARASASVGDRIHGAIFATVRVVDHRLVLQLSPSRRLLGDFVAVDRDMVREDDQ